MGYTKIILYLSLLISLLTGENALFAQLKNKQITEGPDINFDHLTEKDGLSNDFTTDILRDKDGFLWVGTFSGLNRYDGGNFSVFMHKKNDTTSILNNTISSICEDERGNIWGGTESGIFCYIKSTDKFRNYRTYTKGTYPRINDLICDHNSSIWAGTDNGLLKLDPATGRYFNIHHDPKNKNTITPGFIGKYGLAYDSLNNGIWMAVSGGLNFYDSEKNKFVNHFNSPDTLLFNDHVISSLHIGKNGILWMLDLTTKEILGWDLKQKMIRHKLKLSPFIKNTYFGTIFETSDNQLWYSSASYETIKIDLSDYTVETYKNNLSDPSSIIGDFVSSIWEDKDQTIWFGTYSGISLYNPSRMFYRVVKLSKDYAELDNNWQITCIHQNPDTEDWWIGSRDGKIYIHSPANNSTSVLDITSISKGFAEPKFISNIIFYNHLAIISSAGQPTIQYDTKTKKVALFYGLTGKYKNYKTRVIIEETDSTYILGNNYFPLLRWNFLKNTLEEINFKEPKDYEGRTYSGGWLNGYKNKGAWVSAQNSSLGYIHPGDTLIYTFDLEIGTKVNEGGFVNSLGVDPDGNVYFSYITKGIYKVKKNKTKVEKMSDIELYNWDRSDGLLLENANSSVSSMDGKIWCASSNRFSVYDPGANNFLTFKINLNNNNSFYYNYFIQLENGNMLTNIKGDLVEFFPEKMKNKYPTSTPLISVIQLPKRSILLTNQREVILEPEENFLTINFGSLTRPKFFPYHFQYKMEGINDEWITVRDKAEAVFSNLQSGTYTFRLRMVSNDKQWQSKEKSISITIKTPFYKSWWFNLLLISSIASVIFYGIRSRIRSMRNLNMLRTKTQLLEKEKTAVMYENLRQHLNPHFLFNSLTSLSSLIRIDQKKAGDFLDKMSKVYRYVLRNKDNDTVPLIEELKFVDMYNQLQKTRFGDALILNTDIGEEYHYFSIAPVTLQNLVENAIKHNVADQDNPLVINMFVSDGYLVVSNNLQRKNFVETSNNQGQNSMISLYRFLSDKPVKIIETEESYSVHIPLI